jgi:hypothetical protein
MGDELDKGGCVIWLEDCRNGGAEQGETENGEDHGARKGEGGLGKRPIA